MRTVMVLLLMPLVCAPAFGNTEELRGVYVSDMDRNADPCSNFYDYANGSWRAANPIPDSMTRWSRRWAAGETAKDQLKTILEEVSARKDWKKGSVEQQISDYYGACMDQARIDALGAEPMKPLLADIDAMKGPDDVQKMIARLHEQAIFVPFGLAANSDNHEPTRVIAHIYAAGLGLPDRDYYFKAEERFKEAREKYRAHVANMFRLAGNDEAAAQKAAETVFGFETKLADASLDNVALRDPKATDHKTTFADLQKHTRTSTGPGTSRPAACRRPT